MPKRKRVQREHTEDWQTIQQYTLWPEQTAYELLRPVVLFGDPAGKRAQETGAAESTLDRKADTFDEQGMVSFFASKPRKQPQETARSLPPDMRQLIVDLRVELPSLSLREIAEICEVRFDRKPSHNSVKIVLASGPPPSIKGRRYQTWDQIPSPAERRLAAIRLHSEGWSVSSIAEYLGTARHTHQTKDSGSDPTSTSNYRRESRAERKKQCNLGQSVCSFVILLQMMCSRCMPLTLIQN